MCWKVQEVSVRLYDEDTLCWCTGTKQAFFQDNTINQKISGDNKVFREAIVVFLQLRSGKDYNRLYIPVAKCRVKIVIVH